MDKNKRICQILGIEWHEELDPDGYCSCGQYHTVTNPVPVNPNFTTDAGKVQLLREIRKLPNHKEFLYFLTRKSTMVIEEINNILRDYIEDTTGKLLDAFLEWDRRKG